MKKIIASIAALLLVSGFTGCDKTDGNSTYKPQSSQADILLNNSQISDEEENNNENKVEPEEGVLPSGKGYQIPEEFRGMEITESCAQFDIAYLPTMDNIAANATDVVMAKVNGFTNTKRGNDRTGYLGYTIIHVTVTKTLSGDIKEDQELDIITFGGYVSLRDKLGDSLYAHTSPDFNEEDEKKIDNTVVHDTCESSTLPDIGEKYVFYIIYRETEEEPDGFYVRSCGDYAQLSISKDGKTFTRRAFDASGDFKGIETEKYTVDTLIIKDSKKLSQ